MKTGHVVLAGGNGFLGRMLAREFTERGLQVFVLSRDPLESSPGIKQLHWDGRTLGAWRQSLEGAKAVVNLAGRSVNCRYNRQNRDLILNSRVDSTRAIGQSIAHLAKPPSVCLKPTTAPPSTHS